MSRCLLGGSFVRQATGEFFRTFTPRSDPFDIYRHHFVVGRNRADTSFSRATKIQLMSGPDIDHMMNSSLSHRIRYRACEVVS